jgi:hypothetical protein
MPMTTLFQAVGALAILVSLVGTWMAGRTKFGWLLCVASSAMWLPILFTGKQWAAVANCVLSIAICVRNFATASATDSPVRRELELAPH